MRIQVAEHKLPDLKRSVSGKGEGVEQFARGSGGRGESAKTVLPNNFIMREMKAFPFFGKIYMARKRLFPRKKSIEWERYMAVNRAIIAEVAVLSTLITGR